MYKINMTDLESIYKHLKKVDSIATERDPKKIEKTLKENRKWKKYLNDNYFFEEDKQK